MVFLKEFDLESFFQDFSGRFLVVLGVYWSFEIFKKSQITRDFEQFFRQFAFENFKRSFPKLFLFEIFLQFLKFLEMGVFIKKKL